MTRWLATAGALVALALVSRPAGAGAVERGSAATMQTGSIEVSAAKRVKRSNVQMTVRPYRYKKRQYVNPHPSDLVTYSRPYFVPGPPKHAEGFKRNGFGTGAYGFGYN